MDRLCNLAYATLVEGLPAKERAELDRALIAEDPDVDAGEPTWWGGEQEAAREAEQVAAFIAQMQQA